MLRVISGSAKGHKLKTLKGSSTRPTSDKVKGALFNIIAGYLEDAEVLDLFGGTGSLGIEALSRGADSAVIVEKNPAAAAVIEENLRFTKLSESATILTMDAFEALRRLSVEGKKFDLIFLDPPYNKKMIDEALKIIEKSGIIKEDVLIAAEHDILDVLPETVGRLALVRSVKYGDTVLSFYRVPESTTILGEVGCE